MAKWFMQITLTFIIVHHAAEACHRRCRRNRCSPPIIPHLPPPPPPPLPPLLPPSPLLPPLLPYPDLLHDEPPHNDFFPPGPSLPPPPLPPSPPLLPDPFPSPLPDPPELPYPGWAGEPRERISVPEIGGFSGESQGPASSLYPDLEQLPRSEGLPFESRGSLLNSNLGLPQNQENSYSFGTNSELDIPPPPLPHSGYKKKFEGGEFPSNLLPPSAAPSDGGFPKLSKKVANLNQSFDRGHKKTQSKFDGEGTFQGPLSGNSGFRAPYDPFGSQQQWPQGNIGSPDQFPQQPWSWTPQSPEQFPQSPQQPSWPWTQQPFPEVRGLQKGAQFPFPYDPQNPWTGVGPETNPTNPVAPRFPEPFPPVEPESPGQSPKQPAGRVGRLRPAPGTLERVTEDGETVPISRTISDRRNQRAHRGRAYRRWRNRYSSE